MSKFYTIEELEEQFPETWFILDARYGDEGELLGGYIIEQCTDKTIDDAIIKYRHLGKNYDHIRTTMHYNGFIMEYT